VGNVCPVFKSDAVARIARAPVIEVHGTVARCDATDGPTNTAMVKIQSLAEAAKIANTCVCRASRKPHVRTLRW